MDRMNIKKVYLPLNIRIKSGTEIFILILNTHRSIIVVSLDNFRNISNVKIYIVYNRLLLLFVLSLFKCFDFSQR